MTTPSTDGRDVESLLFLRQASSEEGLSLVFENLAVLRERGAYEAALLEAFCSTRTNNSGWSLVDLRFLFSLADRERLRAAGDMLPGAGPFTLYRGVAGAGRRRRVRGLSWTASPEKAQWFAKRFSSVLPDPAVFQITIDAAHVLAYVHEGGRMESEFIVDVPPSVRPRRISALVDALTPKEGK